MSDEKTRAALDKVNAEMPHEANPGVRAAVSAVNSRCEFCLHDRHAGQCGFSSAKGIMRDLGVERCQCVVAAAELAHKASRVNPKDCACSACVESVKLKGEAYDQGVKDGRAERDAELQRPETVERVARALWECDRSPDVLWEDRNDITLEHYRRRARAALAALEEK